MNKIDHLNLDGHALNTFLTVLEEGSVTNAATRLGFSQSAISHTLDKLRKNFDDPLFIRDGRGISPTAKALTLKEPIESILNNLNLITKNGEFEPKTSPIEFTIATNDFPLGFIFPKLLRDLQEEEIYPKLKFIQAGIPSANLARSTDCQLLITPAPPKKKNIISVPIISSTTVCFYDAKKRKPPVTIEDYIEARYVDVRFSPSESALMVLPLSLTSLLKPASIEVPNFNSVSELVKGTDLIATLFQVMSHTCMKDLAYTTLPVQTDVFQLYLVWHQRDDDDPAHKWLREKIIDTARALTS